MAVSQESRGRGEAEMPSTLEVSEYFSCTIVLLRQMLRRRVRLRQKLYFLMKSLVVGFLPITLTENLPTRWHPGDTLPPCTPLIFATGLCYILLLLRVYPYPVDMIIFKCSRIGKTNAVENQSRGNTICFL